MKSWKLSLTLGTIIQLLGNAGAVTIHYAPGQAPMQTGTAAAANYTGAAAYNPTVLVAPPPPGNTTTKFPVQLTNGAGGASIPQQGRFFGFSIEMSVVNQVLGKNSSFIQVPFLNLMANLAQRSGGVQVRVGGNTQETATLVDSNPDGRILEKNLTGASNPTQTPPLDFTVEFLYLMSNISSLVKVDWYIGIPFFDTSNFKLDIAVKGQEILGDHLLGMQVGNEPDLYAQHGHRPENYSQQDYFNEFGQFIKAMNANTSIPRQNILIAPSVSVNWTPQQIWDTGFLDAYGQSVSILSVEKYPSDNCFAQFGVGVPRQAQDMFATYLTHRAATDLLNQYIPATTFAQTKGKPFMMFETNTASCGGFPGVSDSFGAALWGLDYAMTMANLNFTGALFHIGGQNVFYNPFTSPPTNQSSFHQWTVGPIYYSSLVMAEVLGSSGNARVRDLGANTGDPLTPGYVIYENDTPVRVLLINFITDPTGASNLTVSLSVGGGQTGQPNATPASVKVKYLRADSVSQKANFTWANQTFGDHFSSDGRPVGIEEVVTVNCDQTANTCAIPVFAPSAALVFLSDSAQTENSGQPSTTYSTTAKTKTRNTASVDGAVLATSNGNRSYDRLGSTSHGSANAAQGLAASLPGLSVVLSLMIGAAIILGRRW